MTTISFADELRSALEERSVDGVRTLLNDEDRFPTLSELADVPAGPKEYHEEGDTLTHAVLTALAMVNERPDDDVALIMALVHDIGKARTPERDLPHHYGHENRGVEPAKAFAERVGLSEQNIERVGAATKLHMKVHDVPDINTTTVLDMTTTMADAGLSIDRLIALGRADANGHRPRATFDGAPIRARLEAAQDAQQRIDVEHAAEKRGYDASDIGEDIAREEVENWRRQDRAEATRRAFTEE